MKKLKDRIKHSNLLCILLVKVMKCLYFILDHLFWNKKKQILFVSFTGRQYSDSPKELYLAMKEDKRFEDYQLKWAFLNPEEFEEISNDDKVSINSIHYYIMLFQSRVWISNANLERLIPYKSKKILYINTWHGIPLKYIGKDEYNVNYIVKQWFENMEADLITACGPYDQKIFKKVFPKACNIINIGLPRNDNLVPTKSIYPIHRPLKVLYAPTFRNNHEVSPLCQSNIWKKELKDIELFVRFHYFDSDTTYFKDVSSMDLNTLFKEVDVLITDYSSIMFDFAKLEKPVILYPYDKEKYKINRGMYFDLDELPWIQAITEQELLEYFENLQENYDKECEKTRQVKDYFHKSITQQTSSEYILNYIEKEVR